MGWSECSSDVEENHTTYLPPRPSLGFKNQNNSSSYNIHGSTETSTDLARRLHEGRAFQNVQMASSSSLPKKQLNTKKGGCERGDGTEKYEPVVTFGMGKNVTTVVGDNGGDISAPAEVGEEANNMKPGSGALALKRFGPPQGLDMSSSRTPSISSVESFNSEKYDIDERVQSATLHATSHEKRKETLRSLFRRSNSHQGRYKEGGIDKSKSSSMSISESAEMKGNQLTNSSHHTTEQHEGDVAAKVELGRKKRSLRGRIMSRLPSPSAVFRRRSVSLSASRESPRPSSTKNNNGRHRSYTQGMKDNVVLQTPPWVQNLHSSSYEGRAKKKSLLQSTSSTPVQETSTRRGGLRQRLSSRVRRGFRSLSPRTTRQVKPPPIDLDSGYQEDEDGWYQKWDDDDEDNDYGMGEKDGVPPSPSTEGLDTDMLVGFTETYSSSNTLPSVVDRYIDSRVCMERRTSADGPRKLPDAARLALSLSSKKTGELSVSKSVTSGMQKIDGNLPFTEAVFKAGVSETRHSNKLGILLEGFLYKFAPDAVKGVRWHKRYFALYAASCELRYYKSCVKSAWGNIPLEERGSIPLRLVKEISIPSKAKWKGTRFDITVLYNGEGKYPGIGIRPGREQGFFTTKSFKSQAESAQQRMLWVSVIESLMKRHGWNKGGNNNMLPHRSTTNGGYDETANAAAIGLDDPSTRILHNVTGHQQSQPLLSFTEEKQQFNNNIGGSINRHNEEDGFGLPPQHLNKKIENDDHQSTPMTDKQPHQSFYVNQPPHPPSTTSHEQRRSSVVQVPFSPAGRRGKLATQNGFSSPFSKVSSFLTPQMSQHKSEAVVKQYNALPVTQTNGP